MHSGRQCPSRSPSGPLAEGQASQSPSRDVSQQKGSKTRKKYPTQREGIGILTRVNESTQAQPAYLLMGWQNYRPRERLVRAPSFSVVLLRRAPATRCLLPCVGRRPSVFLVMLEQPRHCRLLLAGAEAEAKAKRKRIVNGKT